MMPRLRQVFASVLGVDGTRLTEADSPATIAAWDSVAHISLMLAIEDEFGVRFEAADLATLNSVARIRERLERGDGGT